MALAHADNPKKVSIWCTYTKATFEDDTLLIEVINGEWTAHLIERKRLLELHHRVDYPVVVVWEGEVPYPYDRGYNEAMKWIQEQIEKEENYNENKCST